MLNPSFHKTHFHSMVTAGTMGTAGETGASEQREDRPPSIPAAKLREQAADQHHGRDSVRN